MKDFRLSQKPKSIVFTQNGYDDVQKKYNEFKAERPHAVSELKKARELGDLRENGYYKASRQRLNFIDSQLVRLGHQLRYGVIKKATQTEVVELGSTVELESNGERLSYTIVGLHEANPSEGRISVASPLGSQLVGKKIEEVVTVRDSEYKIMKIR